MSDSTTVDQPPSSTPAGDELLALNRALQEKLQLQADELEKAIGVAEEAYHALKVNYLGIIKVFDQLIEARGHSVTDSAKRIAETAKKITSLLALSPEEEQHIVFAAFLHNIGKIVLPDHLLNRPFVALNNNEKMAYKAAAVRSADILSKIKSLKKTAFYIRHMHERFDGKGYPDGLVGEKIPLGSRIIALTSDYENLQNGTLTGKKHEKAQAINFILENRKSRYDPQLANLLIEGHNAGVTISKETPAQAPAQPISHQETALHTEPQILTADALETTMVLATDLHTHAGVCILPKGYSFTEEAISHLMKLENSLKEPLELSVYVPENLLQAKGKDDA